MEYPKFGLEINHRQTEELIKNSGFPYTFLRNNWYLQIVAPFIASSVKMKKFWYYSRDEQVSWALKREYSEAAMDQAIDIQEVTKSDFDRNIAQTGISKMGLMFATSYLDYAIAGNNGESEASSAVHFIQFSCSTVF
ncbi:hypothetical protein [Paenibacillus sp. IITD108]|uniref:hypothetical protein n=1 Tax=Paenibacillus sp. IITD108 TaxID=3116649 RepID=UPI002F3F8EDD